MGILSAITGVVLVICLAGSGKTAELNNCDNIESCIRYSESTCNAAGQRTVCISWAPIAGCPLNVVSDAVDCVCGQNMIGQIPQKIPCGPLPNPPTNGVLINAPTPPIPTGTVINAMCTTGGTTLFTTCKSDGTYTPYSTSCSGPVVDCGQPPPGMNTQTPATGSTGVGATFTYTCVPGSIPSGTLTTTCQADGNWSLMSGATCTVPGVDCGQPPAGMNTQTPAAGSTGVGATYMYMCVSGFVASGTLTTTCQANGAWSLGSSATCTAVDCGQPPPGMNTQTPAAGSTGVGATYMYMCVSGFAPSGTLTTTCQANGAWSLGSSATCTAVDCGQPPPGMNTQTPAAGSTGFGATYMYMCVSGFAPSGTLTTTCQANGAWSLGSSATCTVVDCGQPPPGMNTNAPASPTTSFGTTFTYTCVTGYEPDTMMTTTCQADGTWSLVPPPTCTGVDCGQPPRGMFTEFPMPASTLFPAIFDYTCIPGRSPGPNNQIMCQADGTWSGPTAGPTCNMGMG